MTDERLRELEEAAVLVKNHTMTRLCRCPKCRDYNEAKAKLSPDAVLELIAAVKEKA